MTDSNITVYRAWDLPTRLFHWINVLCIILLSVFGLIMLNKGAIGISGNEARIGLKTVHVFIGYVFAINLIIRIIWGFLGSHHSRWRTLLPGKNIKGELGSYTASLKSGKPQTFIGHNPRGRLSVMIMLLLLIVMMFTGLVRAGTDIYFPPFGNVFATYVSAEGVSPSSIKPYDSVGTNEDKLANLKAFKKPFGNVHIYGAYILWLLILLHVIAVIRADARGQGTLISAMFSGNKHLQRIPQDQDGV